ncbi:MAG: outer rane biosis protein BamB [Armatimonadetes bacterium]|nr:outer rane biosis protein BamB [Armatimonadota bacterium]
MVTLLLAASAVAAENWPGFRGPRGDGSSQEKALPLRWSATENVAWKVPIPGRGHSSPVVWGDRVFVVSALKETQERILLCLDRKSGKTLWQRVALKSPMEEIHPLNTHASSTPLTDGERVYVSFLDRDKMFIAAFDFQGKPLWDARPGAFSSKHGYCSSPILYKDTVIVNGDHDGDGYIVALNRKTGAIKWKISRPNNTRSYCTPIIRQVDGEPHLMLTGSKCVASYNPENGALQWMMDGPTEQFVAAPVYDGKLLFITSGYPELHILAIRPGGKGKVAEEQVAWRTRRGASYVPSPVLSGPYFLNVSDGGFLGCWMANSGEQLWNERTVGHTTASPVVIGDLVYVQADRGVTTIARAGKTFEKLAENDIGEETFASPAVSQGQLFIRGAAHLFAIGKAN